MTGGEELAVTIVAGWVAPDIADRSGDSSLSDTAHPRAGRERAVSIQQRLLELMWRDHQAAQFLGPVNAHTAAEFLLRGGAVVPGWLYLNERGLVIIGERPLADPSDDPATNSDRVSFWTWSALGPADVQKGVRRRERTVGFERLAAWVKVPDNIAEDLVLLSQQFADAA